MATLCIVKQPFKASLLGMGTEIRTFRPNDRVWADDTANGSDPLVAIRADWLMYYADRREFLESVEFPPSPDFLGLP